MRRTFVVALTAMLVFTAVAGVAIAQEPDLLADKFRTSDTVVIGADETVDGDVYAFAGSVSVRGTVTGDLIAFGGDVTIDGTVEGDVWAGAGSVTVNGSVGGDVRVAGGQVRINGTVGEDVLAGTGTLGVDGSVGEDVIFGSGQTTIRGRVGGNVVGETGAYTNNGELGGAERVTIQETTDEPARSPVRSAIARFASLLVLGLILLWVGRPQVDAMILRLDSSPGRVLLWGLLALAAAILSPIAATIVGAILAFVFGLVGLDLVALILVVSIVAVWLAVALVTFLVVAVAAPIIVASWAANRLLPEGFPGYGSLAIGLAALVALLAVPVLGPIVGAITSLLGAGAIALQLRGDTVTNVDETVTASPSV